VLKVMILAVVVCGVTACGKSSVGKALANRFRVQFIDADDLHSNENREKMRRGEALTDKGKVNPSTSVPHRDLV